MNPLPHALKTLPAYYADVYHGIKTFEVRKHDRPFEVGDDLFLQEWNDGAYTGRRLVARVTYMLTDPAYCKEGFCILGIKVVARPELAP
jgi:hypothetical protein